ncbi:4-coumarate--CoA ligase-like 6 [Leguminivora glycinivorella]|uniref:4-coumarate--CoA ligase-like 6 n=1 Tax=Leguminivora glycinivorella TaxID=1035111 RepID=UPI00200DDA03|nr:4-coumarate--CoA ligase-like 6 [Leguminivora glycinivorella]
MSESSGTVPVDNHNKHHLGHYIRECLLKDPDAVCQIDAATGEEETRRSVLTRATTVARCLRTLGLKPGDVLALGGDNHLDLHIPFYAALMNGYPIGGVDPFFKFDEIKQLFKQLEPKIAFCQQSSYEDYRRAVAELGLDTRVVTFDGRGNSMAELVQQYAGDQSVDDFEVAEFDMDAIYAFLVATSGSTGYPKVAAMKHGPVVKLVKIFTSLFISKTLKPALNLSAVQWVSAYFNAICMPSYNQIKVQTSAPATAEHVIDIINKYRPIMMMSTPSILHRILQHEKPCDLTCFDVIFLSGASIQKNLLIDLKAALRPDAQVVETYGQTECLGPALRPAPAGPLGNCGVESPLNKLKLVDPVTGEIITEPNVPGELWTKGPRFTEYYRSPEETAKAITPDGWYKTGDLLRRDENGYFFFVERLKMLIKFRSYHVVPMELEEVIQKLDGVLEVCVTSIANPVDGEWPVALVVRKPGVSVTAQEIQDVVASKLSEHKQLHGGVIFVDVLPMTSNGKVARAKAKQLAREAQQTST